MPHVELLRRRPREALVDRDQLPVPRVLDEGGAGGDAALEDEVVAPGALHKVPQLQARGARADDEVLGLDRRRRRGGRRRAREPGRLLAHQFRLAPRVGRQQAVDGGERLRAAGAEELHQLRPRRAPPGVPVHAAPHLVQQRVQLGQAQAGAAEQRRQAARHVVAVERRLLALPRARVGARERRGGGRGGGGEAGARTVGVRVGWGAGRVFLASLVIRHSATATSSRPDRARLRPLGRMPEGVPGSTG